MHITAEGVQLFGRAVCVKLAQDGAWEQGLTQPLDADELARRHRDAWLAAGDDGQSRSASTPTPSSVYGCDPPSVPPPPNWSRL